MDGGGLTLISGSLTSGGSLHVLKLVLYTHCLFLTFLGSSYHYYSCKSDLINKCISQLGVGDSSRCLIGLIHKLQAFSNRSYK